MGNGYLYCNETLDRHVLNPHIDNLLMAIAKGTLFIFFSKLRIIYETFIKSIFSNDTAVNSKHTLSFFPYGSGDIP